MKFAILLSPPKTHRAKSFWRKRKTMCNEQLAISNEQWLSQALRLDRYVVLSLFEFNPDKVA